MNALFYLSAPRFFSKKQLTSGPLKQKFIILVIGRLAKETEIREISPNVPFSTDLPFPFLSLFFRFFLCLIASHALYVPNHWNYELSSSKVRWRPSWKVPFLYRRGTIVGRLVGTRRKKKTIKVGTLHLCFAFRSDISQRKDWSECAKRIEGRGAHSSPIPMNGTANQLVKMKINDFEAILRIIAYADVYRL